MPVEEKGFMGLISRELAKRKTTFVEGKSRVTVGWPVFDENEIMGVLTSLLDLRISQGEKVLEFEGLYSREVGTRHAIAVNSGSSANLIALDALLQSKTISPGSEVIIPAATFATVASPILQLGLVPVFVDVEPDTYNIDPVEVEAAITNKTGLIMPVHSIGNPAKIGQIMETARKAGLPVLEDCCESHGAAVKGKMVGSFGAISTLSFFVSHNLTTGEGGMVFCSDDGLALMCRSIREFGRRLGVSGRFTKVNDEIGEYDVRYAFDRLGYNMRMTDIEASIGIAQLKKLAGFNQQRIANAEYYTRELSQFSDFLQLPHIEPLSTHTFYGYPLLIRQDAPFSRMQLVNFLEKNLIDTRPFMGGNLSAQPAFKGANIRVHGSLDTSRLLTSNMFFVGCHPSIGKEQMDYVVGKISEFMRKHT